MVLRAAQDGLQNVLPSYRGTVHAIRSIVQQEGWQALYAGLSPALLGAGEHLSDLAPSCVAPRPAQLTLAQRGLPAYAGDAQAAQQASALHAMLHCLPGLREGGVGGQACRGASTLQPTTMPRHGGRQVLDRRWLRPCISSLLLRLAAW